jgi:hypothetical protein
MNGTDAHGNLTGHNHGPRFGRRVSGCPRCDALSAGVAPVVWRRNDDARRTQEIRSHFDGARHRSGGCGVVCTFGEW